MAETTFKHFLTGSYPPKNHMLRDLAIEVLANPKDGVTIRAPVVPEICSPNGALYPGLLATLVDVLGGVMAIPAVSPDWISTSNLSIHTTRQVLSGLVSAKGHFLRSGRTSVVIGVDIQAETTGTPAKLSPVGYATMTYSRLPGNKTKLRMNVADNPHEIVRFSLRENDLDKPFFKKVGVKILDRAAGTLVLKMNDYVRNSLGSLQGGMTAFLADLAGQYVAQEATGRNGQTQDLLIHYMSPGITGPFQTTAEVLRMDHRFVLTRVHVIDQGNKHRLMAVVFNSVRLSNG